MIRIGMLFHDVSSIIQNLLLAVGVLMVLLGEALAARPSRRLLRRQRIRHRLCRSHEELREPGGTVTRDGWLGATFA